MPDPCAYVRDPRFAELDILIAKQHRREGAQKNSPPPLIKAPPAPLRHDDDARQAREKDARRKREVEIRASSIEARAKRAAPVATDLSFAELNVLIAAQHGPGEERAARLKREAAERALARKMLALSRAHQKASD